MKSPDPIAATVAKIASTFSLHRVALTLGGEPTYVPIEPLGSEWSITALGPTKLRYAYAFADALIAQTLPHALAIYSPGKQYPGEPNPRWAINLLWRRDDTPIIEHPPAGRPAGALARMKSALLSALKLKVKWLRASDPLDPERAVWVLPLDHNGKRFTSADWKLGAKFDLLRADGPAGLRLPLAAVPAGISRRALTLEERDGQLHVFLPPLLQPAFIDLVNRLATAAKKASCALPVLSGYVPSDDAEIWMRVGITADPGVLEINLPPCATWTDYDRWMRDLERAAEAAGLRSFKKSLNDEKGTGGGNHLLFGGPSIEQNALFTHPRWITSILRYWQHHPSLAYIFTGQYVGPSSQAPRPDESASNLYDLELAYQFLAQLPPGDHRGLLSETLRHLHTDSSGNTHRSEISFDKFWNVAFDGGCRGLIEFRAVESLPRADWMSAIALLWHALAAHLLARPFDEPLIEHGDALHDRYFLPAHLWADFAVILRDLKKGGFPLPERIFRDIAAWRFPEMLAHRDDTATLTIRAAHEGWPLLCEQPLEGGSTSRFVDTSIERIEFLASPDFAKNCILHVNGRRLDLVPFTGGKFGTGLRYRRTALYPSLHPGMPPQMPLVVTISRGKKITAYQLLDSSRTFEPIAHPAPPTKKSAPCKKLNPTLLTCDLRLP